jgi:hypothetical protein
MPKQAPAAPAGATRKRQRADTTASPPPPKPGAARAGEELATEREQAVRRVAYELYQARGGLDGHALEDWLQAEALVAGERERSATA